MEILKNAIAGTLESSDAQVVIQPGDNGISLSLQSDVLNQYGRQIKNVVLETLKTLGVENAEITVVDKGALECTIKARIQAAVYRASIETISKVEWKELI